MSIVNCEVTRFHGIDIIFFSQVLPYCRRTWHYHLR